MVRGPIRQTQPTACREVSDPQNTTDTPETRRSIQSCQSRLARPPASRPIAARVPQGPSLRPLRGCGTRARAAVGRPHAPSALIRAHGHPDEDMRPPWPCSIRNTAVRFSVDLQHAPAEGVRGQEAAGRAGRAGRAAGEGGRPLVAAGGRPRTFTAVPQPDRPRATDLFASLWKFVASGLLGASFCFSEAEFCFQK